MSNRRYPGVKPFEAEERDRFFGRDRDIRDLYGMMQLEKLVVLFGKSGFGKSSLLNAGILPRFFEEKPESGRRYQPVVVRFGAYDAGKKPPVEEVVLRLEEIAKPTDEGVFLEKTGAAATLWSAFKQRQEGENRRFLLVFDQFEEFFSYPLPQQERFAEELSELIYTDIPQAVFEDFDQLPESRQLFLSQALDVKAVFAIRSDRLHLLDQLKDRLPAILHKRYELKALARDQAREAIVRPARLSQYVNPTPDPSPETSGRGDATSTAFRSTEHSTSPLLFGGGVGGGVEIPFLSPPFEYLPDALTSILDQLSKSDKNAAGQTGIEAFQLQVLCQYFEDKVLDGSISDYTGDGIPDVRPEDLPDLNTIYEGYYKRRLAELPEVDLLPARLLVENGLLFVDNQSGDARRLSMDGQALVAQFEHRGASQRLLDLLEKTYLIRREVSSTGGYNYEISHDTLIAPILNAKREREADEELADAIRRAEQERLEAERRARETEAEIKAIEEARRRAEAERLQRAAEQGRRRANIFSLIALALLLAACVAVWFALDASQRAKQEQQKAEQNLQNFLEEQRKTERLEIELLCERADDLCKTGYSPAAKELYLRADSIARRHADDPVMQALSDSLGAKIRACEF